MTYTMTADYSPSYVTGHPEYLPCGTVYEADNDVDAVGRFWRWFYGRPLELRPERNVRVRDAAGRVILERWT